MDTLNEVGTAGPTAEELERAHAQTAAQFVYRVQTIGGFGGKGDQLNAYNVFRGDPGFFAEDRARYDTATPAAIASAVREWVVSRPHVALSVVPKGSSSIALSDSVEVRVS